MPESSVRAATNRHCHTEFLRGIIQYLPRGRAGTGAKGFYDDCKLHAKRAKWLDFDGRAEEECWAALS